MQDQSLDLLTSSPVHNHCTTDAPYHIPIILCEVHLLYERDGLENFQRKVEVVYMYRKGKKETGE